MPDSRFKKLIEILDPSRKTSLINPNGYFSSYRPHSEVYLAHTEPGAPYQFQYPEDLITYYGKDIIQKPYVLFTCKKNLDGKSNTIIGHTILYLPPNLKSSYQATYADYNRTLRKIIDAIGSGADVAEDALDLAIRYINGEDIQITPEMNSNLRMGISIALQSLAPNISAEFAEKGGKIPNPQMAQIYRNPEFRTFTFEFQMFARSKDEAEQIQNIIAGFKMAMHPQEIFSDAEGGFSLQLPDTYDIQFFTPSEYSDVASNAMSEHKMFKLQNSALINMDVDYGGSGVPSFFKDGHPVDIRMNLTFKELEILTKEKIRDGY